MSCDMRPGDVELLDRLNRVNDVKIYCVFDKEFATYGRVVDEIPFDGITDCLQKVQMPASGNVYVASDGEFERACDERVQSVIYGGMSVQVGYCVGRNTTYNGFEYHKCSELNVAGTPFMLVLGHVWQIENNSFKVGDEKVFFVPARTCVELYQTTLHLSPLRVSDEGFRAAVVLAKGTNTPLEGGVKKQAGQESELLLQKNKWVIAHAEREPLVRQGAHIGLIGENKELKY